MVIITPATAVLTATQPMTNQWLYKMRWLLLLPAAFALHLAVVSAFLAIGKSAEVTAQENTWLTLAVTLSFSNPNVDEAIARYERERAYLVAPEQRDEHLQYAMQRWESAQQKRPLWPYYKLGAFDIAVVMNAPEEDIQRRFAEIVELAPNERGLDSGLLTLSMYTWNKLSQEQQAWVVERIRTTAYNTRVKVFESADITGVKLTLCVRLPWGMVKNYCRG